MNENQNPFYQIQFLLNELQSHITKINEIIMKMNMEVNKINNPILNQYYMQMNNMNNFMNNMNNMNNNPMNFNLNMDNKLFEDIRKISFVFRKDNGNKIFLSIDENKTINELLNEYCKKDNRFDLVNNYDNFIYFDYNAGIILNKYKTSKIKDIIKGELATVIMREIKK